MGRTRSPNYPAIGLQQAIDAARALWDKEQRTPVAPDVAAKAWGYKSLSGPARTRLASLKQYGLVDEDRHGVRVSDLAMRILHEPVDSPERRQALLEAGRNPDSFRELFETHPNASDDALKAYLLTRRKFTEEGTKQFIRAFRETLGLVKLQEAEYDVAKGIGGPEAMGGVGVIPATEAAKVAGKRQYTLYSGMLSKSMLAQVNLIGDEEIGPEHVDMLLEHLRLARKAMTPTGGGPEPA